MVPWDLGIGVTSEKDAAGRGQGASQRQLYKAGHVQEDREERSWRVEWIQTGRAG